MTSNGTSYGRHHSPAGMMLQHQPRHRGDKTAPRGSGKAVLRRQVRRAEQRQWMAEAMAEAGAL